MTCGFGIKPDGSSMFAPGGIQRDLRGESQIQGDRPPLLLFPAKIERVIWFALMEST